MHFNPTLRALACSTALALAPFAALAETPADTLVIADKIDDMVSLDPAESFEFSGQDLLNNIYDALIELDPERPGELLPGVAESWDVAEDGRTYTFVIKPGLTFHSGNPVTAEDAAWSFRRAVRLALTPSFILTQFGFTPENVDEKIRVEDGKLVIETDKEYAPTFFYNCLTAQVASVIDMKAATAHEVDGDFAHGWLKANAAGGGAFSLRGFRANESYVLEANPNNWRGAPEMKRVFMRHVPETATRRLLLEKGDIDVARRLTSAEMEGLAGVAGVEIFEELKGRIPYLAFNQKNETLANPKVVEAMKYLIDYQGMADSFLRGAYKVHQSFLPDGFLGAITDHPYSLDVEKAKALLAEAGVSNLSFEFMVRNEQDRLEMAQSIVNTFSQAGIALTIRSGTGKEILGEYRARNHQVILEMWGPDYPDPHTNADTFARNADNSDEAKLTGVLAWRNAWPAAETGPLVDAAIQEHDADKRKAMYEEAQRIHQKAAPFAEMFQQIEPVGLRATVTGFSTGGSADSAAYWNTGK